MGYHSHYCADEHPQIGYIQLFFYLNSFRLEDGNLKTAPGSHLFRANTDSGRIDADITWHGRAESATPSRASRWPSASWRAPRVGRRHVDAVR